MTPEERHTLEQHLLDTAALRAEVQVLLDQQRSPVIRKELAVTLIRLERDLLDTCRWLGVDARLFAQDAVGRC